VVAATERRLSGLDDASDEVGAIFGVAEAVAAAGP